MRVSYISGQRTQMCASAGESVDRAQHPTPASLRSRIAETRIKQWRVAQRLGVSEVHLSHVLVERKGADAEQLAQIAQAIEAEAAELAASA